MNELDYTKILYLSTPDDIATVDNLAKEGWVLINILKIQENSYIYWFQSKRKIYTNTKTRIH